MTPRTDEYDNLSATDDDDDDDETLKEDMAALSRACIIASADDITSPTNHHRELVLHHDDDDGGVQSDPLLGSGDALIPLTNDSDDDDPSDLECLKRVQSLYQPLSSLPPLPPSGSLPTTTTTASDDDDDDEDDFETLRAIRTRFSTYIEEGTMETLAEGDRTSSLGHEGEIADGSVSDSEFCDVSQNHDKAANFLTSNIEMEHCGLIESYKQDACKLSELPQRRSSFPPSAQAFIDAIKKNRSLQRFIRSKLIEIEAKIEENKELKKKVKLLKDFQIACMRRTGTALSLKKDPCVQLISAKKSSAPNNSKRRNKKISLMCYGPAENSHVSNYKMVLERFPVSLDQKKWSDAERENLKKGIKQQFQEMVLQISADRISSECSFGDANDMDSIIASVNDIEITPERIREFLPKVNWDKLASMYDVGHTGAECESRWLNCEDPLINHGPWTSEEDKFLLRIVQDKGIRNWFDIAVSLATNRTPFQCLARYQRSLNASMLNSEWTEEEDTQLCSAVAFFGERDWQSVASVLERRTGTQCSNRWKKSLCPVRKGSFTAEEDERLTVAAMLFGRKWYQIAKFVPGRIQSQCRDRYLNSLDPSLKWGGWTKEEDSRLKAAIAKHGFCWSKVAEDMPPRTDSQCRKRWKVLCPDQVPLLQEARKMRRFTLATNFVDRESERPALTLNDFLPLAMLTPPPDADDVKLPRKRKREWKLSNVPKKMRSKRHARKAQICLKEVHDAFSDEVKICDNSITTNDQGDLGGHNISKKFLNPIWKGCTQQNQVNRSGRLPCKKPASRTTNGHYTEDNFGNCTTNRGKTETHKQHCGRNRSAKDSLEHCRSQDSSVVGSKRTVSEKERKNNRKLSKHITGAEPSENKLKMESLESQDGDNITLACFLNNKSKKRWFKRTKNVSQVSSSSRTTAVSESPLRKEQVENQIPSGVQDGLSQTCGTGGTKDLFLEQNVASHRQVRKPKDVNMLIDDDDDDMTLVCLLGSKSKKWNQAAKGRRACSPSKSKKVSVLLLEVHCANKPTIIADDNVLSMSKLVEEQPVLHGGVAEPTNINVEEEDDLLVNFLQNNGGVAEPTNINVEEDDLLVNFLQNNGGVAEPTNINVEEDDLLVNFLQNNGGVAEPTNINVEEEDDLLVNFLQNNGGVAEPTNINVEEDDLLVNFLQNNGGLAEPTNIDVEEEDDLLVNFLQDNGGVAEPTNINVEGEDDLLVDFIQNNGGVAEPTNINVEEEDDLLVNFLQNKKRRLRKGNQKSYKGNC